MNRPASNRSDAPRWRARRSLLAIVAAAAVVCPVGVRSVRADEVTRRLQEELRKRNLFFGDVDGRVSPQLSAALHRYQERKGFSSTGEADTDTLYSLNIAHPDRTPAHLAAAASPDATPPPLDARDGGPLWPDVTVLRSDEARPTPAAGEAETVLAVPTATPAPPPSAAGVMHRATLEQVRDYLTRYLQAGQNNDSGGEMGFYGDRVTYYDEGIVDHTYIARDVTRYDHRWPERRFELIDPVTISGSPDGDPDKFVVNFRYGFHVKNARYTVGGKTDNTWTVSGRDPGDWKIVSMKEQRVREK